MVAAGETNDPVWCRMYAGQYRPLFCNKRPADLPAWPYGGNTSALSVILPLSSREPQVTRAARRGACCREHTLALQFPAETARSSNHALHPVRRQPCAVQCSGDNHSVLPCCEAHTDGGGLARSAWRAHTCKLPHQHQQSSRWRSSGRMRPAHSYDQHIAGCGDDHAFFRGNPGGGLG